MIALRRRPVEVGRCAGQSMPVDPCSREQAAVNTTVTTVAVTCRPLHVRFVDRVSRDQVSGPRGPGNGTRPPRNRCRTALRRRERTCFSPGALTGYGHSSVSRTTPKSMRVDVVNVAPGGGVERQTIQLRSMICARP